MDKLCVAANVVDICDHILVTGITPKTLHHTYIDYVLKCTGPSEPLGKPLFALRPKLPDVCKAYIYILLSVNGEYIYVGSTVDPITRFIEHYTGRGSLQTVCAGVQWVLVTYFEVDSNKRYAVECYMHCNKDKVVKLIENVIGVDVSSATLLEQQSPEVFDVFIANYKNKCINFVERQL
jgi:predicted GIY-YIG superfamily endonuclease